MVEFMIALVLLSIIMLGSMSLQFTSLRTSTDARFTSAAVTVAQSRLEEIRSMSWTLLSASCAGTTCRCFDGSTRPVGSEGPAPCTCTSPFTRTTSLSATGGGCRAVVTVSWATSTGTQQITQALDRMP
jgi:Tfp pilus assembly protein PilV